MTEGPRSAGTEQKYPALQQALRGLLEENQAHAAFLAASNGQRARKPITVVASYPADQHRELLGTSWIRTAVSHALEASRTVVTAGAWRTTPNPPRQAELLVVSSVRSEGSAQSAALAMLLSTAQADLEGIALLERRAREIIGAAMSDGWVCAPASLPKAPVFQPPRALGDDFLQHELRVPLSAASYALEAIAMRHAAWWDGEDERLLCAAQLGLLEAQDILRMAHQTHVASGGLATPSLRAVSLKMALERVEALFLGARARLRLDLYDNLPLVHADPLWLTEALTNLVENALKYSWRRTVITIAARPYGSDRVLITVKSFGARFSLNHLQAPEQATHDAAHGSPDGGGLGLQIVRHFITGMEGDVWVEHHEHGATEVKLALPRAFT